MRAISSLLITYMNRHIHIFPRQWFNVKKCPKREEKYIPGIFFLCRHFFRYWQYFFPFPIIILFVSENIFFVVSDSIFIVSENVLFVSKNIIFIYGDIFFREPTIFFFNFRQYLFFFSFPTIFFSSDNLFILTTH